MFFIKSSVFLILINSFLLQKANSENNANKTFICSIFSDETSTFECTVSLLYLEDNVTPECIKVDNNAVISVGMFKDTKHSIFNTSFVCTSNFSLSVSNVRFKEGIPNVEFTEFRPRRSIGKDYWDTSSYKYHIDVLIPDDPLFGFFEGEVIEYTICSTKQANIQLNVFFEFFAKSHSDPRRKACRIYNMQGNYPIDASERMITIPYIHFTNSTETFNSIQLHHNQRELFVDNTTVFYDPLKGFLLDPEFFYFESWDYLHCSSSLCRDSGHLFSLFALDRHFQPKAKAIYLQDSKFNGLLSNSERNRNGVTLSCNKVNTEVHIGLFIFPGDEVNDTIGVVYSNYSQGEIQKRYFSTAEVPYLTEDERLNVTGWLDDLSSKLLFECRNYGSRQEWLVYYDERPPLYYSREHGAFVCEISKLMGPTFTFTLKHWTCNNIFQCQTVSSYCMFDEETDNDREIEYCLRQCGVESWKFQDECMKSLQTNPVPCTAVGKRNNQFEDFLCEAIIPAKKGVAQCLSKSVGFDIRMMYFQGFDGRIYVEMDDVEPPLQAILQVRSLNQTSYYYTKAVFHFRCEAHSFFFEDGIQWFFKYTNGSVLQPPECTRCAEIEPQDSSNPESNAIFCFEDLHVVEIICSAPLLNSDTWKNSSITIQVFETSVPVFESTETVVFLLEDLEYQSITCQAGGIPMPYITWEKDGQEIQENDTLVILDGNILIFPNYNETFLGQYTCRAKNVAGNTTKVFSVKKHKINDDNGYYSNEAKYLYYVLGSIILVFVITAIFFIRYIKRNKEWNYKEMKEVLQLIEGFPVNNGQQNEKVDPLKLPFNRSYEMERKSFTVDHNVILGRGNFGVVYKGKIEKVEGPVAFKTLDLDSTLQHLKSLASELKILMYIGQHEHLVTLLGVYKREIEKGILYVAVEFCGLGSLDSYLQTYKHLFLKCPFIKFIAARNSRGSNENCQLEINNSQPFSLQSLHSLLKWCRQIASGMEYLGSKHVVHADLATRNVLLTAEGNVKVTDFGLSRRMYNYTEYIKTGDEPLPWKWMAPESLLRNTFSIQSDVWAYGITIWEIFCFGESPYPLESHSPQFLQQLENGMRNQKPRWAPDELYDLMLHCWRYEPNQRPSFSNIGSALQNFNYFNNIVARIEISGELRPRNVNNKSKFQKMHTKNEAGYTKLGVCN